MNANRHRFVSIPSLALLAILVCAKPFAGILRAQSSPAAGTRAPLHAFTGSTAKSESASASGARWPDPQRITNPTADIKCAIVQWTVEPPRPALIVVCPPEEVFAPLRIYFKLSWKRDGDLPRNFQALMAQSKTQTKMHWTSQGDYHVLLQADQKNGRVSRPEWVHFTDLEGIYLKY
jgi:hypothetical protein